MFVCSGVAQGCRRHFQQYDRVGGLSVVWVLHRSCRLVSSQCRWYVKAIQCRIYNGRSTGIMHRGRLVTHSSSTGIRSVRRWVAACVVFGLASSREALLQLSMRWRSKWLARGWLDRCFDFTEQGSRHANPASRPIFPTSSSPPLPRKQALLWVDHFI
jgi:hypothetical protein